MASFTVNKNGKVRAHLCVARQRDTASFDNMQAAEAWAAAQEALMRRKAKKHGAGLISFLPPRVLEAISAIPHHHAEVVEGAIPFDSSSGVYFLIKNEEVIYVGKSVNVFDRIGAHRREGGAWFDSFNVIRCGLDEMAALEEKYILAFMPKMNTAITYKKTQRPSATTARGAGRPDREKASPTGVYTKTSGAPVTL